MTRLNLDLDLHRTQLAACRRCAHAGDIRPIVSLARSPRVMLVGQAPGKTESHGGPPFAGRAGRTLFAWLATAGIDESAARERIYISAVTRCYPGPSPSGRGDRVPTPVERANCSGWLAAEVRMIRPKLIIPVGRLAIDELIGKRALDEIIGREHVVRYEGRETIAVPLPHPSGVSSWIHTPLHRRLLTQALGHIERRWTDLHTGRRVA
jgi:uracil-DNA glycosylase